MIELKMPWLSPEEVEMQVLQCLAEAGNPVTFDQDLLELRVNGEIFILPSPLEGKLQTWYVAIGDYVFTDQLLALIEI